MVTLLVLILAHLSSAEQLHPGIISRVTKKGLIYVGNATLANLVGKEKYFKPFNITVGQVAYNLLSANLTSIPNYTLKADISEKQGLILKVTNMAIVIKGRVQCTDTSDKLNDVYEEDVEDSCHTEVDAKGIKFSVGLFFDKNDTTGSLNPRPSECDFSIADTKITFSNCSSRKLSVCKKSVDPLQKKLPKFMPIIVCGEIRSSISTNVAKNIWRLNVIPPIAEIFAVDMRLLNRPNYTDQFLEMCHRGQVFWTYSLENAESVTTKELHPVPRKADKMLYMWVSEYTMNTLMFAAHVHGLLKFNVTKTALPPASQSSLNTTCNYGICIGRLIPKLAEQYPECEVDLILYSASRPTVEILTNMSAINFQVIMLAYVRYPNGSTKLVAKVTGVANFTMQLDLDEKHLKWSVVTIKTNVTDVKSDLGTFTTDAINFMITGATVMTVQPLLNKYGGQGVKLPVLRRLRIKEPIVETMKGAFVVGVDVEYKIKPPR